MGTLGRSALAALAVIGVFLALYLVARGYASWSQGYAWADMDWNQDGTTSVDEFFRASDVGSRKVTKNGMECLEYFSYKDGIPVKVTCQR